MTIEAPLALPVVAAASRIVKLEQLTAKNARQQLRAVVVQPAIPSLVVHIEACLEPVVEGLDTRAATTDQVTLGQCLLWHRLTSLAHCVQLSVLHTTQHAERRQPTPSQFPDGLWRSQAEPPAAQSSWGRIQCGQP